MSLNEVSLFQGVLKMGSTVCGILYVDVTQVLFDHDGCLKKYTTVMEILQEFYEVSAQMIIVTYIVRSEREGLYMYIHIHVHIRLHVSRAYFCITMQLFSRLL